MVKIISILFVTFICCSFLAKGQTMQLIPYTNGEKWGLVDTSQQVAVAVTADSLQLKLNGDVILYQDGSAGLWTKHGDNLLPFGEFVKIWGFSNAFLAYPQPVAHSWAVDTAQQLWILNRKGNKVLVDTTFTEVHYFNEGFAVVELADSFGVVNAQGELVIPCRYDSMGAGFSEQRLAVQQDGKWGLFDTIGQQVLAFQYAYLGSYHQKRIPFQDSTGKWGFLDREGQPVIAARFSYVASFNEGLAFCMRGDTIGYIDTLGQIVVPFQHFKYGGRFQEGRAYVGNDKRYGIIDVKGNFMIWTSRYVTIHNYSESFAPVRFADNRKMGYLDWRGKPVILGRFDMAYGFKDNLGRVRLNEQWGFVNRRGAAVIPLQYDYASDFQHGISRVRKDNVTFYIDVEGREYWKR